MIKITFSMFKYLQSRATYYTRSGIIEAFDAIGDSVTFNYFEENGKMKEGMIASITREFETPAEAIAWRKLAEETIRQIPVRGTINYKVEIENVR